MVKGNKKTAGTHFDKMISADRKIMDFNEFYTRFEKKILSDGLYMGYYLHIIEDSIFRKYIYYDLGLLKYRGKEGFLDRLYRDYHSVNGYAAEKYGIDFIPSGDTSDEEINVIYPFDTKLFLEDMKKDLADKYMGNESYFNAKDADNVISECVRICSEEYEAVKKGGHFVFTEDYSWEVKNH